MLSHTDSVYIRYALLLNGIAALVPATLVKGRANDPLRYAPWWTVDQHSAVIVVFGAAVIGTLLVYLLVRRNLRRWWHFVLSGAYTGILPGLFYLIFAPLHDDVHFVFITMMLIGSIWGAIVGLVLFFFVGKKAVRKLDPNLR